MKKRTGLITVFSLALTLGASATLLWTDAGAWHSANNDVTNWLDTATGLYPTIDQIDGTMPMPAFAGGVVITNLDICNGGFWIGDNDLEINDIR